jgi:hypothetical protein
MGTVPENGGVSQELLAALTHAVFERNARRKSAREIYFTCPVPEHEDAHASARWNTADGVWFCDVCHVGGGAYDLATRLDVSAPTTTIFAVKDRHGAVIAEHVRVDLNGEKTCAWRRDGSDSLNGLPLKDLPLYGIDLLVTQPPGMPVYVTEGEKPAVALQARGVLAVGTVTGAGTTPADAVLRDLAGYVPILWPDADGKGRTHMTKISRRLDVLGIAHRILDPWPDEQSGRDAADVETDLELTTLLTRATISIGAGMLVQDVQPEVVRWLWYGKLPRGKLVILDGRPDEGKTTLLCDWAARVTTGTTMPFEAITRPAAGVVLLTAEDGIADTIRPRLEAMGADPSRIVTVKVDEDLPSLDDAGLDLLRALIRQVDAALVLIDPLMAYMPDKIDTHNDHHARRVLRKLARLAGETDTCVATSRHVRKGLSLSAKDAGGGSVGFTAAARVVMLAGTDPEDDTLHVLARVKGNLSKPWPSLAYRLVSAGPLNQTVRVEWVGESACTASQLLAQSMEDPGERSELDEAKDAIITLLSITDDMPTGKPIAADEAMKQLAKLGIAVRTWRRAKSALGVKSRKEGFHDGKWCWYVPEPEPAPTTDGGEECQPSEASAPHVGTLQEIREKREEARRSLETAGTLQEPVEALEECQGGTEKSEECHGAALEVRPTGTLRRRRKTVLS